MIIIYMKSSIIDIWQGQRCKYIFEIAPKVKIAVFREIYFDNFEIIFLLNATQTIFAC